MCDCKHLEQKVEAAERTLKQLGEPAYVLYLTRVPAAPSKIPSLIGGILLGVVFFFLLGFIKPKQEQPPAPIQTQIQNRIEL